MESIPVFKFSKKFCFRGPLRFRRRGFEMPRLKVSHTIHRRCHPPPKSQTNKPKSVKQHPSAIGAISDLILLLPLEDSEEGIEDTSPATRNERACMDAVSSTLFSSQKKKIHGHVERSIFSSFSGVAYQFGEVWQRSKVRLSQPLTLATPRTWSLVGLSGSGLHTLAQRPAPLHVSDNVYPASRITGCLPSSKNHFPINESIFISWEKSFPEIINIPITK